MPGLSLWSWIGPKTPPGSMVTYAFEVGAASCRRSQGQGQVLQVPPATPLVSGAACSSLIVLSSLYFRADVRRRYGGHAAGHLTRRQGAHGRPGLAAR